MRKNFHDHSPKISLTVLGTVCFVTLFMCQTRFKITKEVRSDVQPPLLRSKDCWFLYSIENLNRLKCVLKAFIVVTSPLLSLISTALLLFGKMESNPYFFIPWLLLTVKGLLLIQTNNFITILRDMGNRANYIFGFRLEDIKWLLFYSTILIIDLVEAFSFYEVFDLFLILWNHHPGYNIESATLQALKKEIADIMEALSKCTLGSLSKISLGSNWESEESESNLRKFTSRVKFSSKERIYNENEPLQSLFKNDDVMKNFIENLKIGTQNLSLKPGPKLTTLKKKKSFSKCQNPSINELAPTHSKINEDIISKNYLKQESRKGLEFYQADSYNKDYQVDWYN